MTVETTGQQSDAPATPAVPIGEAPEATAAEQQPAAQGEPTPESEAQGEKTDENTVEALAGKLAQKLAQKRINELTWKAAEAERQRQAEAQRFQAAQQRLQQLEAEKLDNVRRQTMPRFEQYGDQEAFSKAVEEHAQAYIAERDRMARDQQAAEQQQRALYELDRLIESRVAEGESKWSDYREVIRNPSLPPLAAVSPPVFVALMKHEKMPELTYYLGKNPSEAHRIAQLGATQPDRAIFELGVIAAKLPQQTKSTSQAPAPPETVGSGKGEVQKRPEEMSQNEFEAWYRRREKARRGR